MQNLVKFRKLEKWARVPVKSTESQNGFIFNNAYTTTIPKNASTGVSSGLLLSNNLSHVALVFGTLASSKNKNLQINQSFIGANDELKINVTNYSDDFVEISPFTHLTNFVFLKVSGGEPNIVDSLDTTERGSRGFGSTGLK